VEEALLRIFSGQNLRTGSKDGVIQGDFSNLGDMQVLHGEGRDFGLETERRKVFVKKFKMWNRGSYSGDVGELLGMC
jgi:hypothetical protein